MAVTQQDIDDLESAKYSGARKIKFSDGREVEYRDLSEINSALTSMRKQLAASHGSTSSREPYRPSFNRGYQ